MNEEDQEEIKKNSVDFTSIFKMDKHLFNLKFYIKQLQQRA
jgi:hypothetical protein